MATAFSALRAAELLRNLTASEFVAGAASFLETLNAIHPFRDGNGRTQLVFLALVAIRAGHPLDLSRLDAEAFLAAMIDSFKGRNARLLTQLRLIVR